LGCSGSLFQVSRIGVALGLRVAGSLEIASPASSGLVDATHRRIGLHLPQLTRSHLSLSISRSLPQSLVSLSVSSLCLSTLLFGEEKKKGEEMKNIEEEVERRRKKNNKKRRSSRGLLSTEKRKRKRKRKKRKGKVRGIRDTWRVVNGWEGFPFI